MDKTMSLDSLSPGLAGASGVAGADAASSGVPASETPATEASCAELLQHVCVAVRLEPDAERILAAVRVGLSVEQGWPARLAAACEELGIRARLFRGTVAQAAKAVGPEHPVVGRAPGRDEWVLMTDRRGRALRLETLADPSGRWASVAQIASIVDPDGSELLDWVVIEPLGLLVSPGQGGGGAAAGGGGGGGSGGGASGGSDHHDHPSPFAILRTLIRQERHDLAVVFVYAVGVGLLGLATPIAVQLLVGTVAFNTLTQPLLVLSLMLIAGLAFAAVLRALQAWVVELLQQRIFVRLVTELAHRLPRVRRSAYDEEHGTELVNRFFDVFTIQKSATVLLLGGLEVTLTAAVGMLVLAFYHPLLLALDVVLMLGIVVVLFVLGRGATSTALRESRAKYAMASWLEEVATHRLAFGLAGGPRLARTRVDQLAVEYLTSRRAHFRVVFRQFIGALVLQALSSGAVLGLGGLLVIERQLTLGQLVAAELIVTAVVASFAKLGKHLETSYDLLAALDKVSHLTSLPLETSGPETRKRPGALAPLRVLAKDVSFAYEGGEPAVTGVSLAIEPGERVALRGRSGAGRSTMMELLAGLRPPSTGRVELDGVDAQDLHRDALRERVALIRRGEWASGTVLENVTFGRTDVDPAEAREALAAVGLLEEMASLPEGLRTKLRRNGSPLSEGQLIRLSIARAIAGRPALLLIDGALDALDRAKREQVFSALASPSAPWTLAIVTSDGDILARCDRAITLVDGTIAEEG
jgi:ABC-type bacteriocin/lantibiotic exporter with double-glycine peptidase domain